MIHQCRAWRSLELGANLVPTRYSGHLLYFLRSTSYGASSAVVLVIQIQNASRQSSSLPGAPCCAAVIVWPLEKRVPLVNRHSTKVLSYVANTHSCCLIFINIIIEYSYSYSSWKAHYGLLIVVFMNTITIVGAQNISIVILQYYCNSP